MQRLQFQLKLQRLVQRNNRKYWNHRQHRNNNRQHWRHRDDWQHRRWNAIHLCCGIDVSQ